MQDLSIYIHIPFCEKKCSYCAFNSFCTSEIEREKYIEKLCEEIEKRKFEANIKTIYIGGGTPSILNENQISKIVNTIKENFDTNLLQEFTIEANPNSITESKLKTWENLGVNRLSVGVQTLNDENLQKIGRIHDKNIALEKLTLAKNYFENVSADLLVGLQNEKGEELCDYAKTLLNLGIKHISCYLLEIYQQTKLYQDIKNGAFKPLSDDDTVDAFEKLSSFLQTQGMQRYEISNFAFKNFESKHNLNYWQRGDYIGFGLSAHSFLNCNRYKNPDNMKEYFKFEREKEILSKREELEEIIMLGLRCNIGVDLTILSEKGYNIEKNPYFDEYLKAQILKRKANKLFLNPKFWDVSNTIISNLLP